MMILLKRFFVPLLFTCVGVLLAHIPSVSAHATPLSYEPAASSLVEKIPDRILIRFSERIEPRASSMSVFGPDGSRIDRTLAAVDVANAHLFSVGIEEGGRGTYTVSWQVVSADDGHFTKGAFGFSIGNETSSADTSSQDQVEVVHSSTIKEGITLWIELFGDALLLGTLLMYAWVWKKTFDPAVDVEAKVRVDRAYSRLVILGLILVLTGTIWYLVLKSADLQELQASSFWDAFRNFASTVAGEYTLYRLLAVGVFGAGFFITRKKIFASSRFSPPEALLLLLLLLVGLFRARVSHAAASHFHPYISILFNYVHLVAKSLWVGGLAAFLVMILPNVSSKRAFTAFSKIMSITFGFVGLTGMYVVWLHLKYFNNLFTTDWGARSLVLLVLAGIMTLLRFYHQIVVDRVIVGDTSEKLRDRLSYTLGLEAFVGIAFLFVTSFLIITTPPLAMQPGFERSATSQGAVVRLAEHPYESSQFLLTIESETGAESQPITAVVVTLQNTEKSIGPLVVDTEKRFEGGYVFPKTMLSPPGNWIVFVSARREGAYDATADFALQYPDDVEAVAKPLETRSFDFFALFHLVQGLGAMLVAILLWYWARYLEKNINPSSQIKIELHKGQLGKAFVTVAVVSFMIWSIYPSIFVSDFQIVCEQDGNMWHTMTPMRNGAVLSQRSVPGCMMANGQNQFPDEREYRYFLGKD